MYKSRGGSWFLKSDKDEKGVLAVMAWSSDHLKFESLVQTFRSDGRVEDDLSYFRTNACDAATPLLPSS
jgi:hypothetical protein